MSTKHLLTARTIQEAAPFTAANLKMHIETLLARRSQRMSKSRKMREAVISEIRRHLGAACIDDRAELRNLKYSFAALCRPEKTGLQDERSIGLELHVFRVPLQGGIAVHTQQSPRIIVNLHTLKRLALRARCRSFDEASKILTPALRWAVFSHPCLQSVSERVVQTKEGTWGVSADPFHGEVRIRTFIAADILSKGKSLANTAVVDACGEAPRMFRGLRAGHSVKLENLVDTITADLMMSLQGMSRQISNEFGNVQGEITQEAFDRNSPLKRKLPR